MKPLYLRRKLAAEHESVLPHSTKRIQANFLLAFGIVLGLLLWMLLH